MPNKSNFIVAGLCGIVGGSFLLLPYIVRSNTANITQRDKLTGSQRMRGMYMNTGSSDAGVDPDWDFKTGTWKGHKRINSGTGNSNECAE